MYTPNDSNSYWWFKRGTLSSPYDFEMFGTIIGLAIYNNLKINLPLHPLIYKLLLDEKPSFQDFELWEPTAAKSLLFILNCAS